MILLDHPRQTRGLFQIYIEDDGPGLRQGVLNGEMCSTKTDGTGIGLSVARGLTEASGGTLTVGNRGDGGAEARAGPRRAVRGCYSPIR